MRRLGVVAEIAGHGGAGGECARSVRRGDADKHIVEHSPVGEQFPSETIAVRAGAGSIWLLECCHGRWTPFPPVREHAPVVPGCGYRVSD